MENSSTKSVIKRSSKRGRDVGFNEGSDEKKSKIEAAPVQLIDINDDCLQAIFEYLAISNLVNLAEANDRFIPAVRSVFSRWHRKKCVSIWYYERQSKDTVLIQVNMAVAFFRHFGHLISSLTLYHITLIDVEEIIQQSIFQHCATSLVELKLNFFNENGFQTITKPFEKVKRLTLNTCTLSTKLSQLSTWFPELVSLTLNDCKQKYLQSLATHLPQLKHLKILDYYGMFDTQTIIEMFRCNSQLKSLDLECDYKADFLQSITDNLPQLNKLQLYIPNDGFWSFSDRKVQFEKVNQFTLIGGCIEFDDLVEYMPFVFTNLEEFKLVNKCGVNTIRFQFSGPLIDFIIENKKLKKLSLQIDFIANEALINDIKAIAQSFPNIQVELNHETIKQNRSQQSAMK